MNRKRTTLSRLLRKVSFCLAAAVLPVMWQSSARADLTAQPDAQAVQWSTSIVQAKLVSLGDKIDLPPAVSAKMPSGRPTPVAYRLVKFQVTDNVDGSASAGDTVKVLVLIGGQSGDAVGPALKNDSVGKTFILFLRPLKDVNVDAASGTDLMANAQTQVIVAQVGPADINPATVPDLRDFVAKIRQAGAMKESDIAAQADAVASAKDQAAAEPAQKALMDIGPAAIPVLQQRMESANAAGRARLKHVIAALSPPALAATPE